jgi:integrase
MKKPFRIKPYKHPFLKFVVRDKLTGTWRRKFFRTQREAKTFCELKEIELHNQGREGVMFPAEIRVAAIRAHKQLEPYGKTIDDAVAHYLEHLRTERGSVPVRQAIDELLQNRRAAGLSGVYLRDLKYRLGRFSESFGERSVAGITTKEIVAWLEGLGVGAVTRNIFRRDVRTLFSFCCAHQYCSENPATASTRAKEPSTEVAVLSVEEARRLIAAASPDMLPYWAIGLFAGLRPSEIRTLEWSDIDFGDALITVRSGKTGRKRFVHMQPNLIEWLKPLSKREGKVVESVNFRKHSASDKIAAGLADRWPVNAMRHSFGSYWLAEWGDINALALQMGNSPTVTEKHYKRAVKPKDAHRFWAITSAGASSSSKVVSISV